MVPTRGIEPRSHAYQARVLAAELRRVACLLEAGSTGPSVPSGVYARTRSSTLAGLRCLSLLAPGVRLELTYSPLTAERRHPVSFPGTVVLGVGIEPT